MGGAVVENGVPLKIRDERLGAFRHERTSNIRRDVNQHWGWQVHRPRRELVIAVPRQPFFPVGR